MSSIPATEELLVLTRATGMTFAKLSKMERDAYTLLAQGHALEKLSQIWFREAFFGGGFFHGDLHGGNIFLRKTISQKFKNAYELTVIDFGNIGRLTREQQRGLIDMMVSVIEKNTEDFFSALEKVTQIDAKDSLKQQASEQIFQIFQNEKLNTNKKLAAAFELVSRFQVELPRAMLSFMRARVS